MGVTQKYYLVDFGELIEVVFQEGDLLFLRQRTTLFFQIFAGRGFFHTGLQILHKKFAQIMQCLQFLCNSFFQT